MRHKNSDVVCLCTLVSAGFFRLYCNNDMLLLYIDNDITSATYHSSVLTTILESGYSGFFLFVVLK